MPSHGVIAGWFFLFFRSSKQRVHDLSTLWHCWLSLQYQEFCRQQLRWWVAPRKQTTFKVVWLYIFWFRLEYLRCLIGLAGSLITRLTDVPVTSEISEVATSIPALLLVCSHLVKEKTGSVKWFTFLCFDHADLHISFSLTVWPHTHSGSTSWKARWMEREIHCSLWPCRVYRPDETVIDLMFATSSCHQKSVHLAI